jgi:hypothetical protein
MGEGKGDKKKLRGTFMDREVLGGGERIKGVLYRRRVDEHEQCTIYTCIEILQ